MPCGDFDKIPNEIIKLIIKNLDDSTFFETLSYICKKFEEFYFHAIFGLYTNLDENPHTQSPTSFYLELLRSMKKILRSLEIHETSKENTTNQSPAKAHFLQAISKWPNGTSIPEDSYVYLVTDNVHQLLDYKKVDSLIVLPKKYPNNMSCLEGLGSIADQRLPALKQLVLYNIDFDAKSVGFMRSSKLNLLCLNDCCFERLCVHQIDRVRELFDTEALYIEPHNFCHNFSFVLSKTLKELIICYRKSRFEHQRISKINLSKCLSLKTM